MHTVGVPQTISMLVAKENSSFSEFILGTFFSFVYDKVLLCSPG